MEEPLVLCQKCGATLNFLKELCIQTPTMGLHDYCCGVRVTIMPETHTSAVVESIQICDQPTCEGEWPSLLLDIKEQDLIQLPERFCCWNKACLEKDGDPARGTWTDPFELVIKETPDWE